MLTFIVIVLLGFTSAPPLSAEETQKRESSSGKMVTQAHTLQTFTGVNLSGVGTLYITQSKQEGFTVEAAADILPLIKVYVKEKTLFLDLQNVSAHSEEKIKYYLNIKDIHNINVLSSSTVFIEDGLETDTLALSVSSFGNANIKINVKKLITKIDGGGKVEARGNADEAEVTIIGAGEFRGSKLIGKKADVQITGAGLVSINASENLGVNIAGEGTVKYCKEPSIIKKIIGKGLVQALPESDCQ